jgi:hypothetical protein
MTSITECEMCPEDVMTPFVEPGGVFSYPTQCEDCYYINMPFFGLFVGQYGPLIFPNLKQEETIVKNLLENPLMEPPTTWPKLNPEAFRPGIYMDSSGRVVIITADYVFIDAHTGSFYRSDVDDYVGNQAYEDMLMRPDVRWIADGLSAANRSGLIHCGELVVGCLIGTITQDVPIYGNICVASLNSAEVPRLVGISVALGSEWSHFKESKPSYSILVSNRQEPMNWVAPFDVVWNSARPTTGNIAS